MMNDFKTDRAVYTPNDFLMWEENGMLELTPKFQRRAVWKTPAKSYLIDTMLRGMTVPPIYLRLAQNIETTKVVREVIDGQQRVRSVLDFVHDKYKLSTTLKNAPWAGKRFSQLSATERTQIISFGFPAEIFKGISDGQVLEVFCRLNMNGVPLNRQELLNGKYFGLFKQTSYYLAIDYLEFWRQHRVFTETNIARMQEVELTSELLIAGNDGMQDKKKSIESFYQKWEDSYPEQTRDEKRFRETMEAIADSFDDELANSEFHRPPLFYTLYCVVYHHLYGLPGIQRATPKKRLTPDQRERLRDAVGNLSDRLEKYKDKTAIPKRYAKFVVASLRQTDTELTRKVRFNSLYDEAF